MERTSLLTCLASAKRYAEEGEVHIQNQKQLIFIHSAWGNDTRKEKRALRAFEARQQSRLAHIERILAALHGLPLN